ncbi:MAG: hypothetical protein GXY52_11080 [Chloroflexi bacterium]|nr:hypothetical protein [Chloroflexota bacterium]
MLNPFFGPFSHRNLRRNIRYNSGCCLFRLIQLILVGFGIKYLYDRSRTEGPTQVWPPQPSTKTIDQLPPAEPVPGRETAKLDPDAKDPWVDPV